ncbi:MAG TPA: hypothetical protein V6D09_21290 [Leptolyngbyaceae cyanobacterium]
MSQSTDERLRWTTSDLDLLPDNGNRYEIMMGSYLCQRHIGNIRLFVAISTQS